MSEKGEPLAQVRAAITGSRLQGTRVTETDPQGFFQVLALPAGSFTLQLTRIGYRAIAIDSVPVRIGHTTNLGVLNLEPEAVPLPEVTISERAVSIDPATTTVGANIDAVTYDALPVGRDYRSVIAFLPHANTSYYPRDPVNVAGATGLENAYYIDGVNVTTPHLAGNLPVTGFVLPYNFVRAVEMKEGGYDARYGRAIGGTVDAVTYSGGNRFEGDVFGFFTNGALTGAPRIGLKDVRSDDPMSYDVGARVGGPIVRDRLWYALAYNPQVESADRAVPGWGNFPDRLRQQVFAGKVTWRATPATGIEILVLGDRSTHHLVTDPFLGSGGPGVTTAANPDPYLISSRAGHTSASLRLMQQLGLQGVLEASVARTTRFEDQGAETARGDAEPTYFDPLTSTVSGGVNGKESPRDARTALAVRGTLKLGAHSVVVGAEYEDNRFSNTNRSTAVYRLDTASWEKDSTVASYTVHNRVPTLYATNTWHLSSRLTLDAGLRWEGEYLYESTRRAQSFPNEWQPRFGASFQVGHLGTQRVFGSFGIYYQHESLDLATLYAPFMEVLVYYSSDPRVPGTRPDSSRNLTASPQQYPNIPGAKVEHHREWSLGYERLVRASWRLTARVLRRDLLSAFGTGLDTTGHYVLGVPGQGVLSFLPRFRRSYTALELSAEWAGGQGRGASVSYLLSRAYGNYPGLYASDYGIEWPGGLGGLQIAEDKRNSTGVLPNDRTHVLKLYGSCRFPLGVMAGTFLTWQSGTPLNAYGVNPTYLRYVFLVPRGSVGRTPAIWDLNLRLAYPFSVASGVAARTTLDWLHIGSPRRPVWLEQTHYLTEDANGNPISVNPTYGKVLSYQPPTQARVGVEFTF